MRIDMGVDAKTMGEGVRKTLEQSAKRKLSTFEQLVGKGEGTRKHKVLPTPHVAPGSSRRSQKHVSF